MKIRIVPFTESKSYYIIQYKTFFEWKTIQEARGIYPNKTHLCRLEDVVFTLENAKKYAENLTIEKINDYHLKQQKLIEDHIKEVQEYRNTLPDIIEFETEDK